MLQTQDTKDPPPIPLISTPDRALPTDKTTQLGAQLKHQFGPALAAADAMIKQQQEHSSANAAAAAAAAAASGTGAPATKAKMAHMNPKRTGVLLDFGMGTSFASFAELWDYLRHNGWATLPGKGLASWYYFPPGSDPKMAHPVLRQDYFDSEDAVIDHVRRTGLERPAPVRAAVSEALSLVIVFFFGPRSSFFRLFVRCFRLVGSLDRLPCSVFGDVCCGSLGSVVVVFLLLPRRAWSARSR